MIGLALPFYLIHLKPKLTMLTSIYSHNDKFLIAVDCIIFGF